jgi:hypothetical protein
MNTKEMLSQIKSLLNAKVNLATMTLENGTVIEAESFEAGQSVFIVTDDEKVALPIGDYTMEDGKILVVADEGVIAEIKDAMEEEKEEDMEYEDKDEKVEAEEVVVEDVPEEVQPEVEEIVKAVVDVIAPVIEEVKAEVEKLKEKYGEEKEDEKKKEEMSAKPSRKPLKHNPEAKTEKKLNKFSQNRPTSTLDRVLEKLSK